MDYVRFEIEKTIYQYTFQKPLSIFCVKGDNDFTMYMPRLTYRLLRALINISTYPQTAIKNAIKIVLGESKKGKKMKINIAIGDFIAKIHVNYPYVKYKTSGIFPYLNVLYVPYLRDMLLRKYNKNVAVDYSDFVEFARLYALPRNIHKAEYELFKLLLDQRSTFVLIEIADKVAQSWYIEQWAEKAKQHEDNMYLLTQYCVHLRDTYT